MERKMGGTGKNGIEAEDKNNDKEEFQDEEN